jgi:hypothetical protein
MGIASESCACPLGAPMGITGGMIYMTTGSWTSEVVSCENNRWTPIELIAAPRLAERDTLWVALSSLHTEIVRRAGLFDRVALERIPTPAADPNDWVPPPDAISV